MAHESELVVPPLHGHQRQVDAESWLRNRGLSGTSYTRQQPCAVCWCFVVFIRVPNRMGGGKPHTASCLGGSFVIGGLGGGRHDSPPKKFNFCGESERL